jgi:Domain of unknown function (DUF1905)/Bacteriocin-protection, YdeI or OmpD-Associated
MPKAARAIPKAQIQNFQAILERLRSRLQWVVVHMSFDAAEVWGLRGQSKVKGAINGFPFRTSLFPTREGRHFLLVNKKMQKGARTGEGKLAEIRIELDLKKRITRAPACLSAILKQEPSLEGWYENLNHSTRVEIAKWIAEPKCAEAKTRRAEQMAERLFSVMDAERELPPILQLAFARDPGTRQGWDSMPPSRRRGHLFGIFYYRTPEAQSRRIAKMLDDARAVAEKIETKENKVRGSSRRRR